MGATALFNVINGEEVDSDFIDTGMNYADAENIDEMLEIIPEW